MPITVCRAKALHELLLCTTLLHSLAYARLQFLMDKINFSFHRFQQKNTFKAISSMFQQSRKSFFDVFCWPRKYWLRFAPRVARLEAKVKLKNGCEFIIQLHRRDLPTFEVIKAIEINELKQSAKSYLIMLITLRFHIYFERESQNSLSWDVRFQTTFELLVTERLAPKNTWFLHIFWHSFDISTHVISISYLQFNLDKIPVCFISIYMNIQDLQRQYDDLKEEYDRLYEMHFNVTRQVNSIKPYRQATLIVWHMGC